MKAQKSGASLPRLTNQQRCVAKCARQVEPYGNLLAMIQMRLTTYRNDQVPQDRVETLRSQVALGIYHIDSTAMAQHLLKLFLHPKGEV